MTTATQNGHHQRGRDVPDRATYTFNNGVIATLRPVSQFTMAHVEIQARKAFPPPDPPMNEVNYGDGMRLEPNPTDPDHERAMTEWQMMIRYKAFDATMELGIELEVDEDALDRVKRVMAMVGTPLDEISDKVAYIKHCCMYDIQDEMPKLAAALRALAGPREEDVADHVATFPDNVSRS